MKRLRGLDDADEVERGWRHCLLVGDITREAMRSWWHNGGNERRNFKSKGRYREIMIRTVRRHCDASICLIEATVLLMQNAYR